MSHKFKGRFVTLSDDDKKTILLIASDKQTNDELHELFTNHSLAELIPICKDKYGVDPKDILAYGKGNPSHKLIATFLTPIRERQFPCFCGQSTDTREREKARMNPNLHEDVDSSFNCARERLLYPDYALLLKVNKNGKETIITSETSKEDIKL